MEFGHLLDYNQYIMGLWKSQVFLGGNLTKKKTVREHLWQDIMNGEGIILHY